MQKNQIIDNFTLKTLENNFFNSVFLQNNKQLIKFTDLIINFNDKLGLISPNDVKTIWQRHIYNSAVLVPLLNKFNAKKITDFGSGAGLPGIISAILMPNAQFVLLDSMEKRCKWLNFIKKELNLKNVQIVRGKVGLKNKKDPLAVNIKSPFVISRAVAPLDKLLPLSLEILENNGKIFALKGRSVGDEIANTPSKLLNKFKSYQVLDFNETKIFYCSL